MKPADDEGPLAKERPLLRRSVGLLVLGVAVLVGLGVWWAVSGAGSDRRAPRRGRFLGLDGVLYDVGIPPWYYLVGAVALALVAALGASSIEKRVANWARTSELPSRLPLSPRRVMAETRGVFAGPVTVTVLIPAHNEEDRLGATLASLAEQVPPPDRVVVVADNCTDDTVGVAERMGAEVFETVDNVHKKAGGLNQALKKLLPEQGDNDLVMVMDADTVLDQGFLAEAVRRMTDDRALMSIGGLFYGEDGAGLIG